MIRRRTGTVILSLVAGATAMAAAACSDPYRDARIEELGEEQSGFEPSEIHRVGQPCLACHDGYGDGSPVFSFGGTLFVQPQPEDQQLILLPNYDIRLIDSEGTTHDLQTNRCGNFYIEKSEFDPAFPVRAEIWNLRDQDNPRQLTVMSTRIGRDGSCGSCHIYPPSPFSPGVVYLPSDLLDESDTGEPPGGCPEPRFASAIGPTL